VAYTEKGHENVVFESNKVWPRKTQSRWGGNNNSKHISIKLLRSAEYVLIKNL